jgi:hypothetical protein
MHARAYETGGHLMAYESPYTFHMSGVFKSRFARLQKHALRRVDTTGVAVRLLGSHRSHTRIEESVEIRDLIAALRWRPCSGQRGFANAAETHAAFAVFCGIGG